MFLVLKYRKQSMVRDWRQVIVFVVLFLSPPQMQLLSLAYRPHHFYVLHVDRRATDMRRALTDLLLHRMPGATNIR